MDDSVDGAVLSGTANVSILSFQIVIRKEVLINDSINIGVSRNGERAEELLGLVKGFLDREGPFDPVDHGFDFFQPRES